jgi:hypothetical protein
MLVEFDNDLLHMQPWNMDYLLEDVPCANLLCR